ncbi:MAG: hypothetical protein K2Z81_07185 [Cyanobacteria bacterium]|nr:hypothetical protein [Cyanobacteriota bacterium]
MGDIDDGSLGRSPPSESSSDPDNSLWLALEGTRALLESVGSLNQKSGDDGLWLALEGTKAFLESTGLADTVSADCLPALSILPDSQDANGELAATAPHKDGATGDTGLTPQQCARFHQSIEATKKTAAIVPHDDTTAGSVGFTSSHVARFHQAIGDANGESIVDLMNDLSTEDFSELVSSTDQKLQSGGQEDIHMSVDPFDRLVFFDDNTNKGFAIEASGMCQRVSRFYDDSLRYGAKIPIDETTRPSLATFTNRIAPGLC